MAEIKVNIHPNSIKAYRENYKLSSTREALIFRFFYNRPTRMFTDREVQALLGFKNRSDVQPRISGLARGEFRVLKECGKTRCSVTGKTVRLVSVR